MNTARCKFTTFKRRLLFLQEKLTVYDFPSRQINICRSGTPILALLGARFHFYYQLKHD